MFTHILVPLDGSKLAERALPVAARIARATGARILLVQAVVVPVAYGLTFEREALQWHLVEDLSKAAQTYLDEIARSEQLAGLPIERVVKVGSAANVILDVAVERGVDLVALTSHGRTGIGRWVLGSVANRVADDSIAPVLILYARDDDGADSAEAKPEQLAQILVPLDGSALAEAALAPARTLALALGEPGQATLRLMLVVTPSEAAPENMPQALIVDGARVYLERVAQRLRAENTAGESLSVTWSVVVNRDVAQGILSAAESGEGMEGTPAARSDLIAMTTHGQGGIVRWALGSIADRVLHAAQLPLLIVRPAEAATRPKG